MTTPVNTHLETRIVEILEAIREVLNRLATLEEKTVWHNNFMNQLSTGQKEISDRLTEHDKDRARIALLERDLQYLTGDVSKIAKQTEILTGIVSELQRTDSAQNKTVGFIEKASSQFILALLGAGAGAIAMKLIGA